MLSKVMTARIRCFPFFPSGTDILAMFKALLCSFLCNLIGKPFELRKH